MQKNLGGDRIGSGAKMNVELHNYGRSTHDLGFIWRSTMSPGTLVPFLCKLGLTGDKWSINLDMQCLTHPTIGPLFGSYKAQADVYIIPLRLYNAATHNNKLGIGMHMDRVKLPLIELTAPQMSGIGDARPKDVDNAQINPSAILKYLGISGIGQKNLLADGKRTFNAVPFLGLWDVYKNYYANKQEGLGAVIHWEPEAVDENVDTLEIDTVIVDEFPASSGQPVMTGDSVILLTATPDMVQEHVIVRLNDGREVPLNQFGIFVSETVVGATTEYKYTYNFNQWGIGVVVLNWRYLNATELVQKEIDVVTFDLENIDTMRDQILAAPQNAPFMASATGLEPYDLIFREDGGLRSLMSSQEGLPVKTYQSDLFNNWLSTEWIDGVDGISAITAIDTSGGSFTMDTLNLSKKVYDLLNRIAVSGGSFNDWLDAVWGEERYRMIESPMYVGGLIKEVVFQEVISNSATADKPLGTIAGRGVLAKKHKGGHIEIKLDEPSYIMGLVSLTPRCDYSQGNEWDIHLKTWDDVHKPALDGIGFQELITERMAWWDTWQEPGGDWIMKSAGKQPAWIEYMTSVNRTFGNFAIEDNEMFMTLNRKYQTDDDNGQYWTIGDLTTYIDPRKYNSIFAETSLDSQNFWMQMGVDITARRKMSAKIIPNV